MSGGKGNKEREREDGGGRRRRELNQIRVMSREIIIYIERPVSQPGNTNKYVYNFDIQKKVVMYISA